MRTIMDPALATLIVSPLAAHLRDERVRHEVARDAAAALRDRGCRDVVVVEAGDPGAVRAAAAGAVLDGASVVAVAGGDGTIRDAAGALAGTGVTVGIVPCGAGNLYASSIGVPRSLRAAIAALATGSPRPFDMGEVRLVTTSGAVPPGPMPFMVACGTGFDAAVIAATSREAKRRYGVAAYFLAASRLLDHLEPLRTILTVDGARMELRSVVVLVANCGEAVPGLLRPRLPIDPADGRLHVFVIPRGGIAGGIIGTLELMTAATAGRSASGAALRLAGTRVRVEVVPPALTEVDGDPFPAASLDARIRPGVLPVILP